MEKILQRVFNVGGLGVYAISKTNFILKRIRKKFSIKFKKTNLLVTFHPVTLENKIFRNKYKSTLEILKKYKNSNIFFTMPNADKDNKIITNKNKNICI